MLPRLSCGLVLLAVACTAIARAGDESPPAASIQVPPGRPVRVSVGVELVEVSQISDRDEKIELEFYVYYTWKDPRFAFDPRKEGTQRKLLNADEIWNPDPQLLDELDVAVRGGKVVHVYPDGTLCFSRYYRGTIAGSLDLHEFPLDRQTLEVDLEESGFELDQVVFEPGEVRALHPERAVPHGWVLKGMTSEANTSVYSKTGEQYSMLRLKLAIERDPHYYFWAIVLPLISIVTAAWAIFWMHPKEFGSQVSVGITAMLTVVAYRISIDSSLPPLTYMTRIDYFLLACQVSVFGAFIVVVAIHVLYAINSHEAREAAHHLIVQCRWLPPALLIVASVLLAWLPARCGSWIMGGAAMLFFAWILPSPGKWHIWWGAMVRPVGLIRREDAAHARDHAAEDREARPLRIEGDRRSAAA